MNEMISFEKKSKVCFFVLDMHERGGLQRVVAQVANILSEKYDVHILTFPNKENAEIPYEINIDGVTVSVICQYNEMYGYFNEKRHLWLIKCIRNYLLEHEIDYLISTGMASVIWTCLAKLFLPCKYICWDHTSFLRKEPWALRGRKLSNIFADHIIVLSNIDASLWNKPCVSVIYNPTPFDFIETESSESFFSRSNEIVALGRFVDVKGFERLLDIWKIVNDICMEPFKLRIIGEGQLEQKLKAKIKHEAIRNVCLEPFVKNPAEVYLNAKLIVLTSHFEGLPMVLIEGQVFFVPAVSYDVPSGPAEIISENETGYLIPDNNMQAFAEKLVYLMNNQDVLQRLSFNCAKSRLRFSKEKILEGWEEILR